MATTSRYAARWKSLLAHESDAAAFLSGPVAAVAADVMSGISGASLVGRRIGAYEILSQLGVGGMGEVYRARDTELGREVAIKVLPAVFTSDPERLTRFEREARVLASLNHPHIGAIYGLVHVDPSTSSGRRGRSRWCLSLSMAILSRNGSTFAGRGLPMSDALALAQQIAEALDHAHRRGVIVHRDLKPANVMLTKAGAKLLDFGLAKWAAARWFGRPAAVTSSRGRRPDRKGNDPRHAALHGARATRR